MADALVERVEQLQKTVSGHKAEIGRRRRALHIAAEELARLRAELAERGIGLRIVPGAGVNPWPQKNHS